MHIMELLETHVHLIEFQEDLLVDLLLQLPQTL